VGGRVGGIEAEGVENPERDRLRLRVGEDDVAPHEGDVRVEEERGRERLTAERQDATVSWAAGVAETPESGEVGRLSAALRDRSAGAKSGSSAEGSPREFRTRERPLGRRLRPPRCWRRSLCAR